MVTNDVEAVDKQGSRRDWIPLLSLWTSVIVSPTVHGLHLASESGFCSGQASGLPGWQERAFLLSSSP